jgi:hypothetical protein
LFRFGAVPIVGNQLEAGFEQPPRDGPAHITDAYESKLARCACDRSHVDLSFYAAPSGFRVSIDENEGFLTRQILARANFRRITAPCVSITGEIIVENSIRPPVPRRISIETVP